MNNSEILVSIGMPVYNGEMYLKRAITSLLNQTHKNIEIIVSNNYSDDRTEEILEYYSSTDQRIKKFNQPSHISVGNNFNFVLEKSSGKYFMWAACDDYWSKNFISFNLENLEKDKGLVASISKAEAISFPGLKMGDESILYKNSLIRRFIYLINPGINSRNYSVYRTSNLKALNMSNYNFVAADWALAMDLLKTGSYYRDEREIGYYKSTNGRSSNMLILKKEVSNKIIGNLLPLHELSKYIIMNHGIIFIPHLVGLNFLFFCMINRKIYKFLKFFKLKYPKLN